MLRHSVLFTFRDEAGPAQRLLMMKGLAYLRFECPSVRALDFGADLFGGSGQTPVGSPNRKSNGGSVGYDVALHLDFANRADFREYSANPIHRAVSAYNASVCREKLTARVDWNPEEGVTHSVGHLRHTVMFVWNANIDDAGRKSAFSQVEQLMRAPETETMAIGIDAGENNTNYDWMIDVQLFDLDSADHLINGETYGAAMSALAPLIQPERTARQTHLMHGL